MSLFKAFVFLLMVSSTLCMKSKYIKFFKGAFACEALCESAYISCSAGADEMTPPVGYVLAHAGCGTAKGVCKTICNSHSIGLMLDNSEESEAYKLL